MALEPLLSTPLDDEEIRTIDEYLEQIEKVIEDLDLEKIGTTEAIRKVRETSAGMSG